jgi:hypothetical protein
MFSRKLTTVIIATAAMVSAAPAIAGESNKDVESQKVPPCCERMAKQIRELQNSVDQAEKKETKEQGRREFVPPASDDSYAPNSWGG